MAVDKKEIHTICSKTSTANINNTNFSYSYDEMKVIENERQQNNEWHNDKNRIENSGKIIKNIYQGSVNYYNKISKKVINPKKKKKLFIENDKNISYSLRDMNNKKNNNKKVKQNINVQCIKNNYYFDNNGKINKDKNKDTCANNIICVGNSCEKNRFPHYYAHNNNVPNNFNKYSRAFNFYNKNDKRKYYENNAHNDTFRLTKELLDDLNKRNEAAEDDDNDNQNFLTYVKKKIEEKKEQKKKKNKLEDGMNERANNNNDINDDKNNEIYEQNNSIGDNNNDINYNNHENNNHNIDNNNFSNNHLNNDDAEYDNNNVNSKNNNTKISNSAHFDFSNNVETYKTINDNSSLFSDESTKVFVNKKTRIKINMCENPCDIWYGLKKRNGKNIFINSTRNNNGKNRKMKKNKKNKKKNTVKRMKTNKKSKNIEKYYINKKSGKYVKWSSKYYMKLNSTDGNISDNTIATMHIDGNYKYNNGDIKNRNITKHISTYNNNNNTNNNNNNSNSNTYNNFKSFHNKNIPANMQFDKINKNYLNHDYQITKKALKNKKKLNWSGKNNIYVNKYNVRFAPIKNCKNNYYDNRTMNISNNYYENKNGIHDENINGTIICNICGKSRENVNVDTYTDNNNININNHHYHTNNHLINLLCTDLENAHNIMTHHPIFNDSDVIINKNKCNCYDNNVSQNSNKALENFCVQGSMNNTKKNSCTSSHFENMHEINMNNTGENLLNDSTNNISIVSEYNNNNINNNNNNNCNVCHNIVNDDNNETNINCYGNHLMCCNKNEIYENNKKNNLDKNFCSHANSNMNYHQGNKIGLKKCVSNKMYKLNTNMNNVNNCVVNNNKEHEGKYFSARYDGNTYFTRSKTKEYAYNNFHHTNFKYNNKNNYFEKNCSRNNKVIACHNYNCTKNIKSKVDECIHVNVSSICDEKNEDDKEYKMKGSTQIQNNNNKNNDNLTNNSNNNKNNNDNNNNNNIKNLGYIITDYSKGYISYDQTNNYNNQNINNNMKDDKINNIEEKEKAHFDDYNYMNDQNKKYKNHYYDNVKFDLSYEIEEDKKQRKKKTWKTPFGNKSIYKNARERVQSILANRRGLEK
ncbi:conserved Plasmodium protein, unknown function [Plasmodium sp. gorilla clade G3]|nr:conserved Plasmodium protein, unknown function [Plasmodium sp. gorilla clade G3]